ncbi:molybdenum ABC transporter ATP-binding protein [Marinobacter orientalis]|uniref:Molybdenum ABC transporter ATP-binding protein n=1 Tax=Marinobacter orientalis TaxID=1928859 RepID=A0A7Y0NJF2_9GAMM|nr:molybdenum ABC transporter ATP-binding protein [Marinobacter orientalis]NMT62437.1 molybdenum ABC transporter ATP-binding protein [Marinobacter orientalis]TGX51137.1 molybdenum ABC transporter ATP-binding protein [Marinobacter orientalis]
MTLAIKARLKRSDFELDVDIELPLNGVTSLFGRSGCGKTTLLRIMAGLEKVRDAEVRFGNQIWQHGRHFVPLHQRQIGIVFQEHSLLPHLSVRGNLLYGYKRTPESLRRLHLGEVTDMLGITGLLDRPTDRLSGGQRQRVSVGRALLASPQLLLLDEPLSALDTQNKREIMPFLSRLTAESGVPIVMVTHSPDEVERLADRVVFMEDGRITSHESLQKTLTRPDSPLFADEGAVCVLEGSVQPGPNDGLTRFGNEHIQFLIQTGLAPQGKPMRLRIHSNDVAIARYPVEEVSVMNQLPVTIEQIVAFRPGRVLVAGKLRDGQTLTAEITEHSCRKLGLENGQHVHALIKSVALLE